MSPTAKCTACSRGPLGAEGHLDLFVHKMLGNRMQFHCRTCSTFWDRMTIDGSYRWGPTTVGLEAPNLPGSAPEIYRRR